MGKPDILKPEKVSRKDKKQVQVPSKHLMSQQFLYDPTITITEAARRSFVEITDYVLYNWGNVIWNATLTGVRMQARPA